MNKLTIITTTVFGLFCLLFPLVASAGDFDGTKPLLVSVPRVHECTPDKQCQEITAESIDLARFLLVDFNEKVVRPARADSEKPGSQIERMESVDGKLILQGAEDGYEKIEDGLGWTMAISEDSGKVVLTASGEQVAFVIFGVGIPR